MRLFPLFTIVSVGFAYALLPSGCSKAPSAAQTNAARTAALVGMWKLQIAIGEGEYEELQYLQITADDWFVLMLPNQQYPLVPQQRDHRYIIDGNWVADYDPTGDMLKLTRIGVIREPLIYKRVGEAEMLTVQANLTNKRESQAIVRTLRQLSEAANQYYLETGKNAPTMLILSALAYAHT